MKYVVTYKATNLISKNPRDAGCDIKQQIMLYTLIEHSNNPTSIFALQKSRVITCTCENSYCRARPNSHQDLAIYIIIVQGWVTATINHYHYNIEVYHDSEYYYDSTECH